MVGREESATYIFCCPSSQVTYTWESLDGWSGIPPGGYALKNLVLPPPVPAEAGQAYRLRLTARFTGSTAAATADALLVAIGSPLSARLLGPSGDVMGDKAIVLDASRSLDPDDTRVSSAYEHISRQAAFSHVILLVRPS